MTPVKKVFAGLRWTVGFLPHCHRGGKCDHAGTEGVMGYSVFFWFWVVKEAWGVVCFWPSGSGRRAPKMQD